MADVKRDIWYEWLLHRRSGGDAAQLQKMLAEHLYPIRDKVLTLANLGEGESLLDVGCGDGLIGFGALEKTETSRVIFSDISQDLLDHAGALAHETGADHRCQFLRASADDLSAISSASVDIVTTRSVLIYVDAKQQAFDEFYRVLKPKGRLSIFEPINSFTYPEPPDKFGGFDATPILEIAHKLKAFFYNLQPPESDPMGNFNERDLLEFAEKAGFSEIYLEFQVKIEPPEADRNWERQLRRAGNPKIPSLEEAMKQVLTPDEIEKFTTYIRPRFDAGEGKRKSAVAYLRAIKE